MNWIDYLLELRRRLINSLLFLGVLFIGFYFFAKQFFAYIALPLLNNLPEGGKIVATTIIAPFLVPIKLSLLLSILVGMPFLLYQLWTFVAPALYPQERKFIVMLLYSSIALFYLGVAFAYFIFLPLIFQFLIGALPEAVAVMTDMSHYLDFITKFIFAFGIAFEVPIFVLLLVHSKVINYQSLQAKRPYIIVLAFVLGMLLTPPDVISQIMLAIPLWLLFEAGMVLARFVKK